MRLIVLVSLACLLVGSGFAQTKPKKKARPRKTASVSAAATPAKAVHPGEVVYTTHCLTCHQQNGAGVPKLNPPLRGTEWVTGDKARLIGVLLEGLQGVDIDGETYDNVMPPHAHLTDQNIADVLTYIRSNFGNQASAVTLEEVATQRAKR